MRHLRSALSLAAAAAMTSTLAVASPAHPVEEFPNITINIATFNGSGCPIGTAVAAISPDGEAITLIYSDYLVELSGPVQENCTMALELDIPAGLSVTLIGSDYYGFKRMSSGTQGSLWTNYRFQGDPQVNRTFSLTGATGSQGTNWDRHDTIAALTWSPCGEDRLLIANSRLTIAGTGSSAYITMDSTDVEFSTVFNLLWTYC